MCFNVYDLVDGVRGSDPVELGLSGGELRQSILDRVSQASVREGGVGVWLFDRLNLARGVDISFIDDALYALGDSELAGVWCINDSCRFYVELVED